MVGRLSQPLDHLYVAPGIDRSAENHLLKEIGRDQPRAGECHQHAAGPQNLHSDQVDVFVAARSPLELALRVRELWRVEDHYIELAPLVTILPQELEYIATDRLDRSRLIVQRHICLELLQRGGARVDRRDLPGARARRRDRKAAGVAEAVEHLLAGAVRRYPQPILG